MTYMERFITLPRAYGAIGRCVCDLPKGVYVTLEGVYVMKSGWV